MATPHPNKTKMEAAVARWIGEAQVRPDCAQLLSRRAEWVAAQLAILGRDDLAVPDHLTGLTAWDLLAAQHELECAARGQSSLEAASVEALSAKLMARIEQNVAERADA